VEPGTCDLIGCTNAWGADLLVGVLAWLVGSVWYYSVWLELWSR
jgi:hypothetical protein